MLRQLRTEARLTQEELAEQAGVSPRSVSDLERGINRTARKDSALMLASALKLTGPVQEAFVAAARGRAEPARVLAVRSEAALESSAAATRTLPRDIGGFTGRERELTGLEKSLAKRAGAERGIDAATAPNGGYCARQRPLAILLFACITSHLARLSRRGRLPSARPDRRLRRDPDC